VVEQFKDFYELRTGAFFKRVFEEKIDHEVFLKTSQGTAIGNDPSVTRTGSYFNDCKLIETPLRTE
jgi:hypothetical protein